MRGVINSCLSDIQLLLVAIVFNGVKSFETMAGTVGVKTAMYKPRIKCYVQTKYGYNSPTSALR